MKSRSLSLCTLLFCTTTALSAQIRSAPARARDVPLRAPLFEVDPMWPKPMPNHYILGSAVGVAVDSRDHVFVVHLTDSFNARTESGSGTNPPTSECCTPAPNILEYDPAGNLVASWGGKAQGYDWPELNHGVSVDNAGNIWVGGSGGADSRILKFARDGKFIAQFGKAGISVVDAAVARRPRRSRPTATAWTASAGLRVFRLTRPPTRHMSPTDTVIIASRSST
jgi:hypothetical protein